jgi:hypothetical protein
LDGELGDDEVDEEDAKYIDGLIIANIVGTVSIRK